MQFSATLNKTKSDSIQIINAYTGQDIEFGVKLWLSIVFHLGWDDRLIGSAEFIHHVCQTTEVAHSSAKFAYDNNASCNTGSMNPLHSWRMPL
mgnify:CR=1 FL=1